MAEYNVRINVKNDTGYDQLYPESKSNIIEFDNSNSNLTSSDVENGIKEVNTKATTANSTANTNKTNIGTLASLTTDVKTNLVGAINEVDSHADSAQTTANTNKTNIGTLSNLKTAIKTSVVNAINWLYDNVVHKTNIIDDLDDIIANQSDGMVAGAKAVAQLNSNLYYRPGDNISIVNHVTSGYWTNANKQLSFSIPLSKSVADIVDDIKINDCSMTVRQNGSYCLGGADGKQYISTTANSWSTSINRSSGTIEISITFGQSYGSINNDTCGIILDISGVFT